MTTANNHTGCHGTVGRRVELARYTVTGAGERILYGQRVDGVVRVTDYPARGRGRVVLVERELEQDGNPALQALIADYLDQARAHDQVPMLTDPLQRLPRHPRQGPQPPLPRGRSLDAAAPTTDSPTPRTTRVRGPVDARPDH